jgi:hypothetical protein
LSEVASFYHFTVSSVVQMCYKRNLTARKYQEVIDCMRAGTKRSTLTVSGSGLEQEKVSKSFYAERRGFVEDKARTAVAPVVAITSRGANRARPEGEPIDEGDRPERRMRFRNGGEVKQLANQSINYSAFVIATVIPTAWFLSADLLRFVLSGELSLSPSRLAAIATGIVWGGIVAWVTNVPQVLYFYRPGGRNKKQRRLFLASAAGLFVSASALVVLGMAQVSPIEDYPGLTLMAVSLVIIGLLPMTLGCARSWRYIYLTDPRGVYIAYTGQVLQPHTLYRTGLSWKTPALEHYLESEEDKISKLRFKDGEFELRYSATVSFPETPVMPEEYKVDSLAHLNAASEFLLEQLQKQCAKFTGMQCMKMLQGMKPVEEYVYIPALEPEGYEIPIRMRWSGRFKLSDV